MPRINPKFAKLAGKAIVASLETPGGISARSLKNIEVVAERAQELAGGDPLAASTVSTICTADCISTASCVCAQGIDTITSREPEVARAIAVLHERAISELGVDGLAEAMVRLSK